MLEFVGKSTFEGLAYNVVTFSSNGLPITHTFEGLAYNDLH